MKKVLLFSFFLLQYYIQVQQNNNNDKGWKTATKSKIEKIAKKTKKNENPKK